MAKYAPQQLLAPEGELEVAMFPGVEDAALLERLQSFIDKGYAQAIASGIGDASLDGAALAWAYHLAYKQRLIQLTNMASTITIASEGSASHTDAQRATIAQLADEWRSTFYGYLATGESSNDSIIPPSGTSKTHFGWGGTLRGTTGGTGSV